MGSVVIIRDKISSRGEDVERRDPDANLGTHQEVSVELVGERKLELSLDPAIPPLGRCQQRGSGLDRKSG